VVGVYTQPDRPAGRGRQLAVSPVKAVALEHGVPVYQPASFKAAQDVEALAAIGADLMVVVAYGLLLPQPVLDAPRLGCVNIHASLLPRWRGAAPIQRAVLAGDAETGITIMRMEAGLDTGPMLHVRRLPIAAGETGGSLHDRLSILGAEALMEALPGIEAGTLVAQPQDDALATYARKLQKAEALIDWALPAAVLERQVRAFNPWPVAETRLDGETLRIWRAQAIAGEGGRPGEVMAAARDGVEVAAGEGRLRILELQPPGRRVMAARDFLNARDLFGAVLG
jgi:methionyl-tRNA formyltransferase